ncbi:unnamed protein product [Citrullus colocynthis]|uniref:Bifunctional inhibitor/plant lipid transfer protein/seed storage helical domain-containing protein n=1 Tax=Citrullus colocynthis TaxID=252529 RepID=A0ABP0Z2U3_9ROSI
MKRLSITSLCVVVAAVATMALLAGARLADAVDCSPSELSPCLEAIRSSSVMPSSTCCVKMEEQAPCLCQYAKIPEWKPFISGGQRVAAACSVNLPELMENCLVISNSESLVANQLVLPFWQQNSLLYFHHERKHFCR